MVFPDKGQRCNCCHLVMAAIQLQKILLYLLLSIHLCSTSSMTKYESSLQMIRHASCHWQLQVSKQASKALWAAPQVPAFQEQAGAR